MKIVSLLPSATEIVFALGLGESLVGRSFECDYPTAAEQVPIVSGTALPVDELLTACEIDEAVSTRVAAGESICSACHADVVSLDPSSLDDVIACVGRVGAVTGTHAEADSIMRDLRARVMHVRNVVDGAVEEAAALLSHPALAAAAEIWALDANASFSRPGPRVVDGVELLASVLHPDAVPARAGATRLR